MSAFPQLENVRRAAKALEEKFPGTEFGIVASAYLATSDAFDRVNREVLEAEEAHAATVAALEERVAELEAPIDGLLGWFAQHARLCGAQEWIDRLNALAPTEEPKEHGAS